MGGMSGGAPATYSQGGNPAPYIPTGQAMADQQWQQLYSSLANPYFAGQTPPQQNYPAAQAAAQNIYANPYAPQAQANVDALSAPGVQSGYDYLAQSTAQMPYLTESATGPGWYDVTSGYWNNPYYQQALQGAQTGAGIGAQAAGIAQGQLPQIAGLPNLVSGLAAPIGAAIPQVLQTAMDPQNALYSRMLQQTTDQANAVNAMYGVGASPYGAGLTSDALRNFNIDWQNQQLARQTQGLQAAGGAATTAGNLYSAIPGIAQAGLGLGSGAANLAAGSAGLPSGVYTGQLGAETTGMQNQLQAALQGVSGLSGLGGIGASGLNLGSAAGLLPYQTNIGMSQEALPALQSATNLGLQQYQLPQTLMGDIMNYLSGGRQASDLAAQEGKMGFDEARASASGLGQLLGMAGGIVGPLLAPMTGGLSMALGPALSGIGGAFGGGGGGGGGYSGGTYFGPGY